MIQIAFLYSEQSFALFAKRLCSIFEHHLSSLSENRKISKGRKWRRKNLGHLIFWSWSRFFWKKNTESNICPNRITANKSKCSFFEHSFTAKFFESFALFAKLLRSIFEHEYHLSSLSENRKISKGRKWRRKNLGHLIFWSWSNFFWKKNTEESNIWSKSHSFTANKVLHCLQNVYAVFLSIICHHFQKIAKSQKEENEEEKISGT